ncbi:sulfurtransferase [Streptosporangium sp. CA-115845]|uniref:sulfurtransferase n=1 Tax=Streptosporangium sp. CA-115845 TaxID=3240071 RepID=UPI003D903744
MSESPTGLIGADELAERLGSGARVRLLDVRWQLGDPHGHRAYLEGHLPGAVFVDLDTELAAPPSPEEGRHPLPDLDTLQRAARRWGLDDGDEVVAYDAGGGLSAARAWWLLRWAGVSAVRLLDGGLRGWTAAGHPVETGEVRPEEGNVTLTSGALPVLDADAAADLAGTGVLLDARAAERYLGRTEPVDPRAGHIPGAVNAPTGENLTPDATFLDAEALAARFGALGVKEDTAVGVYCGSGVTAAHTVFALERIGVHAALYAGSWSQWSNDPDRPAATG